MAKAIGQLTAHLRDLVNTQRGYVSQDEITNAWRAASYGLFNHYYGHPALYQPGRPLPPRAYQLTQAVTDALKNFIKVKTWGPAGNPNGDEIMTGLGVITLPADWVHPTSMRLRQNASEPWQAVRVLNDDEAAVVSNDPIIGPTNTNPVVENVPEGYQLSPRPVGTNLRLMVQYLSAPPAATFVETGSPVPTYDDTNSVDLGWPAWCHGELLVRAAAFLGVTVRDTQLVSFGLSATAAGA